MVIGDGVIDGVINGFTTVLRQFDFNQVWLLCTSVITTSAESASSEIKISEIIFKQEAFDTKLISA